MDSVVVSHVKGYRKYLRKRKMRMCNEIDERWRQQQLQNNYSNAIRAHMELNSDEKIFLELVEITKPRLIYQTGRMHFFAYDGFVMYTFECEDSYFNQKVLHSIEFSNQAWSE